MAIEQPAGYLPASYLARQLLGQIFWLAMAGYPTGRRLTRGSQGARRLTRGSQGARRLTRGSRVPVVSLVIPVFQPIFS